MATQNEQALIDILKNHKVIDAEDKILNRSINKDFPYMVLTRGYSHDAQYEQWCIENIGLPHGECDMDSGFERGPLFYDCCCHQGTIDSGCFGERFLNIMHGIRHNSPIDLNEIDLRHFGFGVKLFKEYCPSDQYEKIKIKPSKYTEGQGGSYMLHFEECDINELFNFLRTLNENQFDDLVEDGLEFGGDFWTYAHSHVGNWITINRKKTGYDYYYQDFCFRFIDDAIKFRLMNDI